MNKRDYNPDSYEKKILELRTRRDDEARLFNKMVEAKETAIREHREWVERKALLVKQVEKLKSEIIEKEEHLQQILDRKNAFLDNAKLDLKRERESVNEARKIHRKTTDELEAILPVVKEFKEFIEKEQNARQRWQEEQSKADKAETTYKEVSQKTEQGKAELLTKEREMEIKKTYLVNLYGKLATYVVTAKETIEYVNEYLEKNGIPMKFNVPGNEIIEVTLDNFNQQ